MPKIEDDFLDTHVLVPACYKYAPKCIDTVRPADERGDGAVPGTLLRIEDKLDRVLNRSEKDTAHPDYVSIKQAASITGLSQSHVRRAIKKGELQASNQGTALHPIWRIDRKDIERWMERKKGGTVKVPPKSELKELVNRYFGGD